MVNIYNRKNKKIKQLDLGVTYDIFLNNGRLYYSKNENFYVYNVALDREKLVRKNMTVTDIVFSKSGYNIYTNYMSFKDQEKCNYKYNFEILRMTSQGEGYKSIFKYFAS